jgi:hypothetical protein
VDCIGGSTDCKIGFFRTTTDDLRFADCSNATCSSGSITLVDGNTGCGLTGCSTTASTGHYAEMKCLSATDCKFVYQNDDLADLTFADCDSATCNSGTQQTIDGDGALKSVVGYYTDVDCTGGSSDCKIAYYDTTESALVFYDCDNATCSTGTLVYLDGKDGCTLTGCVTTADAGGYVALDCSTGVNDCKIAYYVDGSTDDLYFADCDSATCNVGTTRMIDGGASCPLTGCTTSATVGTHPNIDCSAGTADCKIAYKNETTDDLLFADCDTATCSSGTRTVVDGTTGCALTGCSTTNDVGINAALSCPTATDCKIAYYDNTRTSLRFADCDNAACTSGTASILEGDTGCLLTGCSTSTSSGTGTTIDCSPGASDCKIAYYNSTGGDLNFVDCNNATCTSGTISQLEGSAGCALTNCSTSVFADSPTIACGGDGSNCKVAYYRSYDFSFADCDNAACTSGTTTVLDGTNGCALTGCSTTNTFEIVFSLDCKAGLNDCKVAYHETDNGDIYFADCNNGTCASGTTNLADDGADRVWAQLVSSSGAAVPDGIITTRSSSYSRLRTPAISPTTATAYGIRLASTDSLNITADVRAARMIVSQSGALSATQTQVEVGNYETSTATSYTQLTNKKIYRYDANKFTPTPTTYFEATISNSTAGQTTSVALYSDGASCTTVVSGSEVTVTGTTWTRVRSSAVTLNDDTDYMVCIKTTANTAQIANARAVLDQSGTIYGTELVYNLVNTAQTDVDTAYTSQNGLNYFDPALFSGSTNYYFESDIKTSAGTGYAQLYNSSDVTAVSSSEVSTTGASYSRQRSNALTMPVAAKNIDAQIKNSSTNTTTVSSADLIVQAGSPPTSTPTRRTSESCYSNNCLEFNGSDNSVSITNTTALDLDQGLAAGVSFAGWVKVSSDGETNVGQIVSKGDSTYLRTTNEGSDRLVDLEASLDLASSDATVTITNGLPLNEWHHVALAYTDDSDDEISVYIDGKLRGTSSNGSGAPASDGNDWLLGGSSSANFHGFIDEVRLYNYERTAQQITLDYTAKGTSEGASAQLGDGTLEKLNQGLVAYYPMDEAAANTCSNGTNDTCDKSGNGNDGAWNGDATTGSGKFGNGVSLDGTGDYVVDSNGLGTFSDKITIAAWIKPSALGTTRKAFIANESIFKLDIDTDSKIRFLTGENWGGSLLKNNTALTTQNWYLVTAVYDGSTKKIYLNGQLDSTIGSTSGSIGTSSSFYLGDYGANLNPYAGSLDEVRIYNRALSPDEVQDLYNYAPGPVAHWKLDENTGTSAADASSNSNTGTLTNGPTWAPGKFGSGVKFDGSDDYINGGSQTNIDNLSTKTVSLWVNPTSYSHQFVNYMISKYTGTVGWAFGVNGTYTDAEVCGSGSTGKVYVYNGTSSICSNQTISTGQWTHVAFTYTGSTVTIFINGLQVGSGSLTLGNESSANISLGARSDNNWYLNGAIDDVRIYNYALSQKQIVNVMNGREGYEPAVGGSVGNPVLHLGFDDGYGTTAQDSSPQNNDGTLTNMAAPATSTSGWSSAGKFGKALAFDGTNDYVSVGNNSSIIPASSISISTWAKFSSFPSDNTNTARILVRNDSGYFLYVYGDVNDRSQLAFMLPDAMTAWSNVPIYNIDNLTTDTWYHIVGTWDGSTARLYINNKLVSSTLVSGSIASTDITRIGTTTVGTEYYMHGLIDEVKIYNYALTEDDIRLEYNRGAAVQLGATSTASNGTTPDNSSSREYCVPGDTATCNPPVAEWKFDENTGTTANDTSGNNNTGTLTNGPTWTTGKTGSGVNLSPSNSYVSVADSSSLNITGDLTISTWVKPNAVDSTARLIMGKGNTSATTSRQYGMRLSAANQWQAFVYSGSTTYSVTDTTTTPSTSRWDQLTVVRDATANTLKFYTNGILRGTASSVTGSLNSTANILAIGREGSSASNYFGGMVDNMRIYNYARTPAQVAWEYNRGGPVAHYKLDECQGTTAYNSALNSNGEAAGNNGTITIGASGSNTTAGSCKGSTGEAWKDGASGKFNSSLEFDDTDDYLNLGTFLGKPSNYSLSFWIKPSNWGSSAIAESASNGGNISIWGMIFRDSGDAVEIWTSDGISGQQAVVASDWNSTGFPSTNWTHITATVDGSSIKYYKDGRLINTVAQTVQNSGTASGFSIGRLGTSTSSTFYSSGQIDDVRIYNYALTPAQVKDLYNGGAVNFR